MSANPSYPFVCTNYVLVESLALVQNRLGLAALNVLQNGVLPLVQIEWVEETLHGAGMSALLTASRRQLNLADCISFETIRFSYTINAKKRSTS